MYMEQKPSLDTQLGKEVKKFEASEHKNIEEVKRAEEK